MLPNQIREIEEATEVQCRFGTNLTASCMDFMIEYQSKGLRSVLSLRPIAEPKCAMDRRETDEPNK